VGVRQLRLVVAAEDYAAAVRFYRDVLGLAEEDAFSGPGGAEVTILDAGRATLELANPAQRAYIDAVEVGREVAPRLRVAFEVGNARGATAAAVRGGASVVAGPVETPWRSLNARLEAPAGLQITLFEELGRAAAGSAVVGGAAGTVRVREATEGDWAAIWPFLRGIVAAGESYTWPRDVSEADARAGWFPAGGRTLVAGLDGAVVGTARITPNQQGPGRHVANGSVMVDPTHEGRGVGRALGRAALAAAAADGYRAMQFNAVVATNTRAVALWRSLGFAVVGRVPEAFDSPTHGLVDLLVMHRRL
jgi:L-amino acid N-acyltransferase YncA/predicted enzyme related to lactoylglutathione lyase